jgi:hypothetical protein
MEGNHAVPVARRMGEKGGLRGRLLDLDRVELARAGGLSAAGLAVPALRSTQGLPGPEGAGE